MNVRVLKTCLSLHEHLEKVGSLVYHTERGEGGGDWKTQKSVFCAAKCSHK